MGNIKRFFFISIACLACTHAMAWTTWDNKAVPTLPTPANPVICSTSVQLYMALRTQRAGREIVLKNGTYDISTFEPLRIDSPNVSIRGMSGDPTAVTVVGKGFENCVDVEEEMVNLFSTGALFADFTLSECRCNCVKFEGGANHNTVFHNMHFLNVGERMIKNPSVDFSESCSLRYCHFENTKVPSATRCGSNSTDQDGNYIAGIDIMCGRNWVIRDNVFLNIKGSSGGGRGAIFLWGMSENMVSERNTIVGCDRSICYGNPNGSYVIDGIIRNNFINRGAGIGIEICHSSGIKTYNNTVYSATATYSRTVSFYQPGSANEFKNNIVFGDIYRDGGTAPDTARNLVRTTIQNWFVSPATGDLHLNASATAAINNGLTNLVTNDWDDHIRVEKDAQPDIGADEYNSIPHDRIEIPAIPAPGDFGLSVFPNPFNPATKIRVSGIEMVHGSAVDIKVFTISGKLVQTLRPSCSQLSRGILWDAAALPAGVYAITAVLPGVALSQRTILVK